MYRNYGLKRGCLVSIAVTQAFIPYPYRFWHHIRRLNRVLHALAAADTYLTWQHAQGMLGVDTIMFAAQQAGHVLPIGTGGRAAGLLAILPL